MSREREFEINIKFKQFSALSGSFIIINKIINISPYFTLHADDNNNDNDCDKVDTDNSSSGMVDL